MRIRTEGDYAYREDAIEDASSFYDVNKTQAVINACEDVPSLVGAVETVLERDDLTTRQKQEIAETLSSRSIEFQVSEDVQVIRD